MKYSGFVLDTHPLCGWLAKSYEARASQSDGANMKQIIIEIGSVTIITLVAAWWHINNTFKKWEEHVGEKRKSKRD
jgi:hypothetical protein